MPKELQPTTLEVVGSSPTSAANDGRVAQGIERVSFLHCCCVLCLLCFYGRANKCRRNYIGSPYTKVCAGASPALAAARWWKKTRGICFFTLCYLPCHPLGANANKITLVILGSSPKLLLFLSPQLLMVRATNAQGITVHPRVAGSNPAWCVQ